MPNTIHCLYNHLNPGIFGKEPMPRLPKLSDTTRAIFAEFGTKGAPPDLEIAINQLKFEQVKYEEHNKRDFKVLGIVSALFTSLAMCVSFVACSTLNIVSWPTAIAISFPAVIYSSSFLLKNRDWASTYDLARKRDTTRETVSRFSGFFRSENIQPIIEKLEKKIGQIKNDPKLELQLKSHSLALEEIRAAWGYCS